MAKNNTDLWKKIKEIIEGGNYVPAEYIRDVIAHFIEANGNNPILFDGPIRSQEQDKVIRPILGKCIVICLDLDPENATNRLLHRRIDPETWETFPENFEGKINPKTGNELIIRKDDNLEAIKKRISWSMGESLPLVDIWKKDWYEVHHINANDDIEKIFQKIEHIIISSK